jgi:hypothetical protein
MHNERMSPRLLAATLALGVASAGLAGCSGDDDAPEAQGQSSSASSPSASPYLPVPDDVTLTPQGTSLELGDEAVVAWEPRQDTVGVLDLTVTKIERTTTKKALSAWQLSDAQKASTPYFVHVSVSNAGDTDLGGRRVPLYAVNDENLLLESTPFASSFAPCPSTPLPDKFRPGASADVCLVYLAPHHGTLEAVSFRPEETFDPITWTGEIVKYAPPKSEQKKPKKGAKSKGKGKKG